MLLRSPDFPATCELSSTPSVIPRYWFLLVGFLVTSLGLAEPWLPMKSNARFFNCILFLFSPTLVHSAVLYFSSALTFQVKIALDWLRGNRVEYRRFAAVLILKVSIITIVLIMVRIARCCDSWVSLSSRRVFSCLFLYFWNLFIHKFFQWSLIVFSYYHIFRVALFLIDFGHAGNGRKCFDCVQCSCARICRCYLGCFERSSVASSWAGCGGITSLPSCYWEARDTMACAVVSS